jgi:signal transduction histidine kinase
LELQDQEQRHIAREPHDSAGQTLVALDMQLAKIGEIANKNPDRLTKEVESAEELVRHLTQELRTTSKAQELGIRGMREREHHLRGELVIESNDSVRKSMRLSR